MINVISSIKTFKDLANFINANPDTWKEYISEIMAQNNWKKSYNPLVVCRGEFCGSVYFSRDYECYLSREW